MKNFLSLGTLFETKKNTILLGYGSRVWLEKDSDSKIEPKWYFPDYFLRMKKPWFIHECWEEVTKEELINRLGEKETEKEILWENSNEAFFDKAFENLHSLLLAKTLYKAVPYLFHLTQGPISIKNRLLSSLKKENNLLLYGFWDEKEGILGATPETLFEIKADGSVATEACAGTVTDQQKLDSAQNEKLHKEHNFVVQNIMEALSEFGRFEVGHTEWRPFIPLKHLVTSLRLVPSKRLPFQLLVEKLHPTAAVGAYPKTPGMSWLIDYDQKLSRNRFGAPVGCLFPNGAICRVGIRNMQWDSSNARIGVGVGVIEASTLAEEKNEIAAKMAAVKGIFNL